MGRPTVAAPIPAGYCQCGCGSKTRIAAYNDQSRGHVKGLPLRFADGHRRRKFKLSRPDGLLFDEVDRLLVESRSWWVGAHGYAWTHVYEDSVRRTAFLHRLILQPPHDLEVDHINGNRLDNRRANLRVVSHEMNLQNRAYGYGVSRYRGVTWSKRHGKWRACSQHHGRRFHLGLFEYETDAARAVRSWLMAHSSGFVASNYPIESEAS